MNAARFGNSENPANFAETLLSIDQVGYCDDVGADFGDPVETGEAGIENAVLDVARHFLSTDEHALNVGVVDGREVRT